MDWFGIALICALCTACADALSKRIMKENDEWITGAVILVLAWVILSPLFFSLELKPVSADLIAVLAAALPLELLGYYLFLTAIRMDPLSLTVPLLALTPVFTILTAALLVGEEVSVSGGVGISLVTVGAYVLNADVVHRGLFAPVLSIASHRGARRMVVVAFIWSITSALGKKGVLIYGALPFLMVILLALTIIFLAVSVGRWVTGRAKPHFVPKTTGLFLVAGLAMAASELTHFLSISMAPVAYMVSVKRLSMVFGVLLGWLMFHEENIRFRLVGASLMVTGVFFIYR